MSYSIVVTLIKVNSRCKKVVNGIHCSGLNFITNTDIDKLIERVVADYNSSKTPVDHIDIKTTISIESSVMGSSVILKASVKDFESLRYEVINMALRCNVEINENSRDKSGAYLLDVKDLAYLHYDFIKHTGKYEEALNPEVFQQFLRQAEKKLGEPVSNGVYSAYIDCCNHYNSLHGSLLGALKMDKHEYIKLIGKLFIEHRLSNR